MDLPARVEAAIGDEEVAAHVALDGDDAVYVTPTRSLIYRGQGLLSEESIEEHSHDVDRIDLKTGRRKATIQLDHGIDGESSFSVPSAHLDEVIHPVLAGVLNAADVTTTGETVVHTYRFSELTLVITSHRVVKHVGEAVWATEFEMVPYAELTRVALEEGSVASQLVLETRDQTQRVKVPQDQAALVHHHVVEAVCEFHDVPDYEAFEQLVAEREEPSDPDEAVGSAGDAELVEGLDPIALSGGSSDDHPPDADREPPGTTVTHDEGEKTEDENEAAADDVGEFEFESMEDAADLQDRVAELEASLEEQAALIEEQQKLLEEFRTALNRRDP